MRHRIFVEYSSHASQELGPGRADSSEQETSICSEGLGASVVGDPDIRRFLPTGSIVMRRVSAVTGGVGATRRVTVGFHLAWMSGKPSPGEIMAFEI